MLEFYATSGDFTRRLTSIKANSKFSSPLAGPEEYYSVRFPAAVIQHTQSMFLPILAVSRHDFTLLLTLITSGLSRILVPFV